MLRLRIKTDRAIDGRIFAAWFMDSLGRHHGDYLEATFSKLKVEPFQPTGEPWGNLYTWRGQLHHSLFVEQTIPFVFEKVSKRIRDLPELDTPLSITLTRHTSGNYRWFMPTFRRLHSKSGMRTQC